MKPVNKTLYVPTTCFPGEISMLFLIIKSLTGCLIGTYSNELNSFFEGGGECKELKKKCDKWQQPQIRS